MTSHALTPEDAEPMEITAEVVRLAMAIDPNGFIGVRVSDLAALWEAREENTRLREQLGKIGWIEAALKEIAQDTGIDCMGRDAMREIVYRHRAATL